MDKNKCTLFVLLLSLIPDLRFQCTVWNVFFYVAKFYTTDLQHNVKFHYTFLNDLTLNLAATKREPSIFRNSSREKWQNTQLKCLLTIDDRSIEMFLILIFPFKKITCYTPLFRERQLLRGWNFDRKRLFFNSRWVKLRIKDIASIFLSNTKFSVQTLNRSYCNQYRELFLQYSRESTNGSAMKYEHERTPGGGGEQK